MKLDTQMTDKLRARGEEPAEPGTAKRKNKALKPQDVGLAPTSEDTPLGPTDAGLMQGGEHIQGNPAEKR